LIVIHFQWNVTRLAIATKASQMIGPAEQLVMEGPGIIDNGCPRDKPGIVERQRRFGEAEELTVEKGERSIHVVWGKLGEDEPD
jgi:hypothetical protein